MNEEWRWVPGHEGRYEVSDQGGVRSHIVWRRPKPFAMKHAKDKKGYSYVNLLGADGRQKSHFVHRLVLLAFDGPSDLLTRHLDGNPENNQLSNLRYGTNAENQQDSIRHGTNAHLRQTHCKNGHAWDAVNTYRWRGKRVCRTCNRAAVARHKALLRGVNA